MNKLFSKLSHTTSNLFNKNNNNSLFSKLPQFDKDLFLASYMNQGDAQNNLEKYNLKRDDNLSSNNTKVFYDTSTNQPYVLHRGTKTFNDVIDDGLVGLGLSKYSHRHKNAERVNKKILDKYGTSANNYGTSLGGHLAENSNTKGNVVTYNKAVGLSDVFKRLPSSQTDYRVVEDIISLPSLTQSGSKKITLPNKNKNPISIINALNAHRIQ